MGQCASRHMDFHAQLSSRPEDMKRANSLKIIKTDERMLNIHNKALDAVCWSSTAIMGELSKLKQNQIRL